MIPLIVDSSCAYPPITVSSYESQTSRVLHSVCYTMKVSRRVYIASTYTDMVLEKTELVNHIFPILKSYCKYEHF